jgi:DNA polymerase-3 subunit beta
VLANLKNDQVSFSLGDALGSALITMPNSDKFKYVVMPMRI